jgi:hypothetical protein
LDRRGEEARERGLDRRLKRARLHLRLFDLILNLQFQFLIFDLRSLIFDLKS